MNDEKNWKIAIPGITPKFWIVITIFPVDLAPTGISFGAKLFEKL